MPYRFLPVLLLFVCLNLSILRPASAQNGGDAHTRRPLAAMPTTTPPTIDGDLSDPAWKNTPKAEGFVDRQNGTAPADQTTAYLLYDDKFLYVAFLCKDSLPDKITARETVRDQKFQRGDGGQNEDNVEVDFDPFLTHRDNEFARFSVNPLGTKSARINGGRGGKAEWKGDCDAAVKRLPEGWSVEMRIPWAILAYPNGKKPVTMGLNFTRWQDRTKTESIWSNTGPQGFSEYEGLWTDVVVPAGAFHPKLSLLPYILPSLQGARPEFRAGLDARYPFTPELTGVGSLNPDFGTIEGAVEGIAFSRSERFVPERRPFFLEGQDYFRAGQDFGIGRYFYPNRIPTFSIGAKFFGKVTPADTLGILNTESIGRRNDLVANYRHDLSPTSNLGLFLFRQWGFHVETGIQADRPSTFIGPRISLRALRKLDLIYSGSIQNFDGLERQHILTANYELSPTRSIGGRVVMHNSAINAYVSVRQSGEKGTEYFFIVGDPNAERFRTQVALKIVFAL